MGRRGAVGNGTPGFALPWGCKADSQPLFQDPHHEAATELPPSVCPRLKPSRTHLSRTRRVVYSRASR